MIQNSLVKLGGGNSVDLSALLPVTKKTVVFTESDTWQVPDHVTKIWVTGCGGGGGGGGYFDNFKEAQEAGGGGGGGGAAVIEKELTVTPGSSLSITIGLGGTGGTGSTSSETGSDGSDGGDSKVGSLLVLAGGKGGKTGSRASGGSAGAAGGSGGGAGGKGGSRGSTPTNGTAGIRGSGGIYSRRSGKGGGGGGGSLGKGGNAISFIDGNEYSGNFPGFGGGGAGAAITYNNVSNKQGYGGGNGIIIIQYLAETPQPSAQMKCLTEIAAINVPSSPIQNSNYKYLANFAVIAGGGVLTLNAPYSSASVNVLFDTSEWASIEVYSGNDVRLFFDHYIIVENGYIDEDDTTSDGVVDNRAFIGYVQT